MTIKTEDYQRFMDEIKFKNGLEIGSEILNDSVKKKIMEEFGMNKVTIRNHFENLNMLGFISSTKLVSKILR